MAIPTYEIYALKYAGPLTRPASMVNWLQDIDKNVQINYYIFAIRGGNETIVVDCGCAPKLAKERNLTNYINPVDALKRIDIDAAKVKYLAATHIHFDHISGVELFPKATIFLQEKEFNFWMKNPIAKRAPFLHVTDPVANRYLARLIGKKRLRLIRGDKKIFPGIELLLCPGHTVGLQTVAVNTVKGKAIVGSDAAHVFSSYRTDIPSAIITDMIAWMKSYDKIRAKASSIDLIFPGHDLALLDAYPQVAEGVSRLA
ncbi:MAG: N-acyl homoserine lactonase family protein [Deltaproteobacteria bacterium]|nr:N-acyl homoserine lactonase family protein [Deltaproteobacteria bacterium]